MQSIRNKNKIFINFILAAYSAASIVIIPTACMEENCDYSSRGAPTDSGVSNNVASDSDAGTGSQKNDHANVSQDLQLSLAKICVSESGFQVRTNDCTLIYHVLRGRSVTGEVTMGIMRAYARNVFNENRKDSRRWIVNLNSRFEEPEGWSGNVTIPWGLRREGFIDVYNHAGDLLRTRPAETPCGVKVSHWGARGFRRDLHLSRGWRLVECGKTNNDFWVVPSRQSAEEIEQEIEEEIEVQDQIGDALPVVDLIEE